MMSEKFLDVDTVHGETIEVFERGGFIAIQIVRPAMRPVRRPPVLLNKDDAVELLAAVAIVAKETK